MYSFIFLTVCIRGCLALSAWKLLETSYAATGERTIALATAAAFFLLCFFVHAPPRGIVISKKRLMFCGAIYSIKAVVALYFGVMANATILADAMAKTTPQLEPNFINLVSQLLKAPEPIVIASILSAVVWILILDFLVFLLERVREVIEPRSAAF